MEEIKTVLDEEVLQEASQEHEDEVVFEETEDSISFNLPMIEDNIEFSCPTETEYDEGVKEASIYIGQFHALINAGMSSDYAITVMSWIREDKLNKETINMQLELAKQESLKVKRETL